MTWQEFWESVSVWQAALWIVGAFVALTFIVKAWPFIRNTFRILDALVRLPDVIEKVDQIHHEVHFNNGSSVKDAVMRVEVGVKGLHKRVDAIDRAAKEVRADLIHEREPARKRTPKKESAE